MAFRVCVCVYARVCLCVYVYTGSERGDVVGCISC